MQFEQINVFDKRAAYPTVNGGIYTKIDWFSAMFEDMTFMDVLKWLKIDCFVTDFLVGCTERLSGFDENFVYTYEGINLETRQFNLFGYEGTEDAFNKKVPKIRLDISGSGLDFLRSLKLYDPDLYLRDYDNIPQPFHCTRCDFAYDLINYKEDFLDQLIYYARTNATEADRLCIFKLNTGIKYSIRTGGQKTIYLGASTSDKMLRVYDKRLQYIDPSTKLYKKANDYGNPDSWIRIELQTRNKQAHGLCYGQGDMLSIFRFIYETYQFTDTLNTNKQNRKPAQFWIDLFNWEEIPKIIQNANSVQSLASFPERVIESWEGRGIPTSILVYTALGHDEYVDRINKFLTKIQDFSDPLNVRRYRLLIIKLNMFGFDEAFLKSNKHGFYIDENNVLKFRL